MVYRLRLHRAHNGNLVRNPGEMRKSLPQLDPALAVALELENRFADAFVLLPGRHAGEALPLKKRRVERLPVASGDLPFVVEQLELRRCPVLKQVNDPLGLGCEVRKTGQAPHPLGRCRREQAGVKQRRQCRGTDASTRAAKELPTCLEKGCVLFGGHFSFG